MLSRLRTFDNIYGHFAELKMKSKSERLGVWVRETSIFQVIFVILIENSSVITEDTRGPREYPY